MPPGFFMSATTFAHSESAFIMSRSPRTNTCQTQADNNEAYSGGRGRFSPRAVNAAVAWTLYGGVCICPVVYI